jgi:peptidyl-tRNA hydrolase
MINKGDKLYVIVRKDLSPGQMAVQAMHAQMAFAIRHPEITNEWYLNSNYICLLSVENEEILEELYDKAINLGIKRAHFQEEDLDDSLTAICLEPGENSKIFCKCLKLAFA